MLRLRNSGYVVGLLAGGGRRQFVGGSEHFGAGDGGEHQVAKSDSPSRAGNRQIDHWQCAAHWASLAAYTSGGGACLSCLLMRAITSCS